MLFLSETYIFWFRAVSNTFRLLCLACEKMSWPTVLFLIVCCIYAFFFQIYFPYTFCLVVKETRFLLCFRLLILNTEEKYWLGATDSTANFWANLCILYGRLIGSYASHSVCLSVCDWTKSHLTQIHNIQKYLNRGHKRSKVTWLKVKGRP